MNQLNRLLVASPAEFAAAFRAAARGLGTEVTESRPLITVWLESSVAAAGARFVWGHGQVNYRDGRHSFGISGLFTEDVGTATISATGSVMHLRNLADLNGHYLASDEGTPMTGSDLATYLKNEHGVVIKLVAPEAGPAFRLTANGVVVRLKRAVRNV